VHAEALVEEYLGRLQAAAWPISAQRRAELVGEVREHIEAGLAAAGARDETTVRNVLERLGPPEEIVAAEVPGAAGAAVGNGVVGAERRSAFGGIEIAALVLLVIGGWLIPYVGTLLALVFVWVSTRWTQREKLIATGIVVLAPLIPILLVVTARAG
jgi:hypothetical protein